MEKEILKELQQKYSVKVKYIKLLYKICKDNKIYDIKEKIEKYLVCQNGVSKREN